jgi:hypothetical protein
MKGKTGIKALTQQEIDHNFLLKCLAGFTAAALASIGVLAVLSAKGGAAGTAGALCLTTTAAAGVAFSGPFALVGAIVGLAALLAAACILPCLFGGVGNNYSTARVSTPYLGGGWGWGGWSLFSGGRTVYVPSSGSFGGTVHTHVSGPVHRHDGGSVYGGGNVHGHSGGGGNVHGHSGGGGNVHGHSGGGGHMHGHR